MQSTEPDSKIVPTITSTECKFDTCNGICYDKLMSDCCGGIIYPHDYSNFKTGACCGEKWYPTNQVGICCGGIMSPNKTGTCCGGKMYYYTGIQRGKCCGDIMYSYNDSKHTTCCGGKMYPFQGGWGCCYGVYYNGNTHHCLDGVVGVGGGHWESCGDTWYRIMSQSCCKYLKREKNETIAVYFLTDKNKCCEHLPFLIPEDQKCNPNNGEITPKNRTSSSCSSGTGYGSCYEENSRYFPPYVKI